MTPERAVRITRRFHFSASHHYWVADWDETKNREVFGKNTEPHGHNYVLEVTLQGPIDPTTGMILNLRDVKKIVGELLDDYYDHKNLNVDHPVLKTTQPTTECIAEQLAQEIREKLSEPVSLFRVRLWETEDLYAEVVAA